MPIKKRTSGWSKLDNAAKIFPSTREKSDTRVFRFACELYEEIDPPTLQRAVDRAAASFPNYLCVIRKGAFWYYLERRDLHPVVTPEQKRVCGPMMQADQKKLLFEVSYYRRRVNLEMYHVLSDGTGAMQFLKAIVTCYLNERHAGESPILERDSSLAQRTSDSFQKYYQKSKKGRQDLLPPKAYHLSGDKLPEDQLLVIEGLVSVKEVLAAAHTHHVTMTVYLTAVFFLAIHREMSLQAAKDPVVIRIPVNLRQFFPSETARNFFGIIEVQYDFGKRSGEFSDILEQVAKAFSQELTPDQLSLRMNALSAMEHNPFIRIAPLPIKNIALRLARHMSDIGETAVISNIGKVTMPPELVPYIRSFHVLASTKKLQLCVCSFGDRLQLGFTSAFADTDLQRQFLAVLAEHGIQAEVASNGFFAAGEGKEN